MVTLNSRIRCPYCGAEKDEVMPSESCQIMYTCTNCKKVMSPKEGDCCVFCSYGTVRCPAKQTG